MRKARLRASAAVVLALLAVLATVVHGPRASAEAATRVYINGVPSPVYFNDGDSFRVLGGPYGGAKTRLGGYNTLESFGPAHQWGTWHPYELFVNAKLATQNARRGTWHCRTEGELDTYGRLLLDCPDLAVDQIRKGLAHAMQIDDTPSRPVYLRVQNEAIRARRGMWRKGVPDFVLTSLHSAAEDPSRDTHYNRLVSTRDGHSDKWEHREVYGECDWVCNDEQRVSPAELRAVARGLREDPSVAPHVRDFFNLHLMELAARFARRGELPEYLTDETARQAVGAHLSQVRARGGLQTQTVRGSCALYVDFRRRYGRDRAWCLRGHGTTP